MFFGWIKDLWSESLESSDLAINVVATWRVNALKALFPAYGRRRFCYVQKQ